MPIDRQGFLAQLAVQFPEALAQITPCESGLLHCEVAAFRRATEEAMDAGHLWIAEQHFRLIERLLPQADPALHNALEVSYLEDLALGECTPGRYRAVKKRMPQSLRQILVRHHPNWQ
jgi:hypothetical protein